MEIPSFFSSLPRSQVATAAREDGGVFRSGVWQLDVATAHAREVPGELSWLCGHPTFRRVEDKMETAGLS